MRKLFARRSQRPQPHPGDRPAGHLDHLGPGQRVPEAVVGGRDAGGALENVTRTRIILTDIALWKDAARAHAEVFGTIRPVTTLMQVSAFVDPDWLVEIEAEAVL